MIDEINKIIGKISGLSAKLRKLYFLIVEESGDAENFVDALNINLYELQSLVNESMNVISGKISVLASSKYKLITLDEYTPSIAQRFVGIADDYNFLELLREFCESNNVNLEDLLVRGDFSLLD